MKVLAAGGGSGGHVTPVVAVINEIAKEVPDVAVEFICDYAFEHQARGLMAGARVPVTVRVIAAGKFRRYAHLTFWQHFTVPHVVTDNIKDAFKVIKGFWQSVAIVRRFRPDIVFAKGGFVCLPVGLAAWVCGVPLVIHDSDTRPGLTNRILSRFARVIATGAPLENYSYDAKKTQYTGVPIDAGFMRKTDDEQRALKQRLGFSPDMPLVVATGGGLGAQSINEGMLRAAKELEENGINFYLVTGKKQYDSIATRLPASSHSRAVPFVYEGMADVLGAADVVVSRGSATTLQELAGLGKAVIIVPAHQLGDQLKNAAMYENAGAGVVIDNKQLLESSRELVAAILPLARDAALRESLGAALYGFARPHAAHDLAQLIIANVTKKKR